MNCCDWFTCNVVLAGETETDALRRPWIFTFALAKTVGEAALCARMVTEPEGTLDGAV